MLSHLKMPSSYTSSQKGAIAQFVGFTQVKDSVAAKVSSDTYLIRHHSPSGGAGGEPFSSKLTTELELTLSMRNSN